MPVQRNTNVESTTSWNTKELYRCRWNNPIALSYLYLEQGDLYSIAIEWLIATVILLLTVTLSSLQSCYIDYLTSKTCIAIFKTVTMRQYGFRSFCYICLSINIIHLIMNVTITLYKYWKINESCLKTNIEYMYVNRFEA